MIDIAPGLALDERLLEFRFVRASGPGGQNVNKVSTAVELRLSVAAANLPARVVEKLPALAGRRLTDDGVIVIQAQRFRTQERNRQDAIERLVELLRAAAHVPRRRIATKPRFGARQDRMNEKRIRARHKEGRGRVRGED